MDEYTRYLGLGSGGHRVQEATRKRAMRKRAARKSHCELAAIIMLMGLFACDASGSGEGPGSDPGAASGGGSGATVADGSRLIIPCSVQGAAPQSFSAAAHANTMLGLGSFDDSITAIGARLVGDEQEFWTYSVEDIGAAPSSATALPGRYRSIGSASLAIADSDTALLAFSGSNAPGAEKLWMQWKVNGNFAQSASFESSLPVLRVEAIPVSEGYAVAWTGQSSTSNPPLKKLFFLVADRRGGVREVAREVIGAENIASFTFSRGDRPLLLYTTRENETETLFIQPLEVESGSLATALRAYTFRDPLVGDLTAVRTSESTSLLAWTALISGGRQEVHLLRVDDSGNAQAERSVTGQASRAPRLSKVGPVPLLTYVAGDSNGTQQIQLGLRRGDGDTFGNEPPVTLHTFEGDAVADYRLATTSAGGAMVLWSENSQLRSTSLSCVE